MNKNNGDTPESDTRFAPPDVSYLVDRSSELRDRTRAVLDEMKETSRRLHEALRHSEMLLSEASKIAKKEKGGRVRAGRDDFPDLQT